MRSNYRRIGDFIRPVKVKNADGLYNDLQGINIDKFFMPSVANTVGVDLKKYKIIKQGQFACNRMHVGRDYRIPIALSDRENPFIVSPAYDVFEIKDKSVLLPDYLMMWFSRKEFDRNAWFYTDADVRGGLPWKSFCDIELPIPSTEKQRALVKEYNTVVNRIKLNEQLNQKLEETAQALYKHWFVEFEFPNEEGKPYKSSGGAMVYNEDLDKEIPEGWELGNIEDLCEIMDGDRGRNYPSQQHFSENGYCLFLNAGNVTKSGFDFSNTSFITKERDELLRKGKLKRRDTVLTTRGTVGNLAYFSEQIEFEHLRINSGMVIFRPKEFNYSLFLYSLMRSQDMTNNIENFLSGSAQPQLPIKDIKRMLVLIPIQSKIHAFSDLSAVIQNQIELQNKENRKLYKLKDLILSKMTKVEQEKMIVN